jgi:hypothetical protein
MRKYDTTVFIDIEIKISINNWNSLFFLFQSHTIQNLETYTQYRVSLQVFNPEGPGPSTTVLVMTDEGGE